MEITDLIVNRLIKKGVVVEGVDTQIALFISGQIMQDNFVDVVKRLSDDGISTDDILTLYERHAIGYHELPMLNIDDWGEVLIILTNTIWENIGREGTLETDLILVCGDEPKRYGSAVIDAEKGIVIGYKMAEGWDLSVYYNDFAVKSLSAAKYLLWTSVFCIGDICESLQDDAIRIHRVNGFCYKGKVYPTY